MKQLESYINDHRSQLDAAALPHGAWSYIERTLGGDALEQSIGRDRYLLDAATPPSGIWAAICDQLDAECHATDPLEQFICDNRQQLDIAIPDVRVWEQITRSQTVGKSIVSPSLQVTWVRKAIRAAAAIALLVTGVGMGIWYSQYQQTQVAGLSMSDVSNEYAELEQHFERDIAEKTEQLVQFRQVANTDDIHADLEQIDQAMTELRRELADVPPANREQVVRAMIGNYKAKLNILQRVLEEFEHQQQLEQQYNNNPTAPDSPLKSI
jgi:hypothetical protein